MLRSPHDLIVEGLLPTRWYKDFQARGLTAERMWTQELVAYAHRRKLYNLYPPNAAPFSLHCATDHGADKATKRCADAAAARGNYSVAMLPCPGCARFSVSSPLPVIEWDGGCGKDCGAAEGVSAHRRPPPKEPPRAAPGGRAAAAPARWAVAAPRRLRRASGSSRMRSRGAAAAAPAAAGAVAARGATAAEAPRQRSRRRRAAGGGPAASGAEVAAEAMSRVAKMFGG